MKLIIIDSAKNTNFMFLLSQALVTLTNNLFCQTSQTCNLIFHKYVVTNLLNLWYFPHISQSPLTHLTVLLTSFCLLMAALEQAKSYKNETALKLECPPQESHLADPSISSHGFFLRYVNYGPYPCQPVCGLHKIYDCAAYGWAHG